MLLSLIVAAFLQEFASSGIKPLENDLEISVSDFDEYFKLKISTQEQVDLLFDSELKHQIIEFYKKQKELSIVLHKDYLLVF